MPSKKDIKYILTKNNQDLRNVRFPNLNKPFEELTINELVNLRHPGSDVADTYEVGAFTDNVSITTSSIINKIGKEKADVIMKQEYQKLQTLSGPDLQKALNVKKNLKTDISKLNPRINK